MEEIKKDIKLKEKQTIKKLDKKATYTEKLKSNLVRTKEKLNDLKSKEDDTNAENYATRTIQDNAEYLMNKRISEFGSRKKKVISREAENKNKNIKVSNKKLKNHNIKTKKAITKTKRNQEQVKKGIKNTKQATKNAKKMAKESVKLSQRAARATKVAIQNTARAVKTAIYAIITTVKAVIATLKGLIAIIATGGTVAVVIILLIVLVGGFVAVVFNQDKNTGENSLSASNELIIIAKAEVGNKGGDKFWQWYGFKEHVSWCACFVSWCAEQLNYIEKGIIPRFALCDDGINWFKTKERWKDRQNSLPIPGDIIFFDWKDGGGNQDGISDHVGIVSKVDIDKNTVYTVEGNSSDACAERNYPIDDVEIMGYGNPAYE